MRNNRVATVTATGLAATALATIAGCGTSGPHVPAAPPADQLIVHAVSVSPTDPSVLLVSNPEGTRDRNSHCWVDYYATAVLRDDNTIAVADYAGPSSSGQGSGACAAIAIKGPFFSAARLAAPYSGEQVVDARTGGPVAVVPISEES